MRLPQPFYRLPVRFDAQRLQREVLALPPAAWSEHPNGIAGNAALRLISVGGGENDAVDGRMAPTPHLLQSPYLCQVLASFGVVWGRSRLMRLSAQATVPEHADINHHWYCRVRLHIPVITNPGVKFACGDQVVHMAAGEAWLFDNWRLHSVRNDGAAERIHLVADTSGNDAFWQWVAQAGPDARIVERPYDPRAEAPLSVEHTPLAPVMHPAEVDLLLLDLRGELAAKQRSADVAYRMARYVALLDGFRRDWRALYALHGSGEEGWPLFAQLRDRLRAESKTASQGLCMQTNGVAAHQVLEGRVLRAVLPAVPAVPTVPAASAVSAAADTAPSGSPGAAAGAGGGAAQRVPVTPRLTRPVFIVSAPRSGSTLLFETLASSERFCTLGGEAPWLVEDIAALQPAAARGLDASGVSGAGVDSNRLTAADYRPEHAARILESLARNIMDADGHPAAAPGGDVRLLEKTPKNVLRIPFFDRLFPDALFIFLWRDPRETLSSIIEAWRSGRWKTYGSLAGFDRPWSLLLPPGWQAMNGRPVEEIAALQWSVSNTLALQDLAELDPARWTSVRYADFVAQPEAQARRLCEFAGIEPDARLLTRVQHPLPMSRFTQTPPAPDKWQRNAAPIERVLPGVEPVWRRLEALAAR
jgi:hypothetical protein